MPYPPLKITASMVELSGTPKGFVSETGPVAAEELLLDELPPLAAHEASAPPSGATAAAAKANRRSCRRPSGLESIVMVGCPFMAGAAVAGAVVQHGAAVASRYRYHRGRWRTDGTARPGGPGSYEYPKHRCCS